MTKFAKIISVGGYLPENCISNHELVRKLAEDGIETNSDWIESRTGISQRYLAQDHETTTFMGSQAAKQALERAGKNASQVELIIVATSTPDQIFPSTACHIQAQLNASNAFGFDVQAVCSGFVYALTVANSMIRSGQVKSALVIGAEVFSRLIDWKDRRTCVLFGDGAGAVYLEQSEKPGILACDLHSNGHLACILHANARVDRGQLLGDPYVRMDGQSVFKQAVSALEASALTVLNSANLESSQLDLLIPHQANIRILQLLAKKLGLKETQVISTVNQHGNTSAASVPLALNEAYLSKKLKPDMHLLLQGVGGGFTWGSVLIHF